MTFHDDLDGDNDVDLQDLATMLSCYGLLDRSTTAGCCAADLDCDGTIGLQDLSNLLSHFGLTCASFGGFSSGEWSGGSQCAQSSESLDRGSPAMTAWISSATPEELSTWHAAGMPRW